MDTFSLDRRKMPFGLVSDDVAIDAQGSIYQPFLFRPALVSVDDAQAFECGFRQQGATTCYCDHRVHSQEKNIAASPKT